MQRYPLYIGGEFRDSASGAWFETENPYTLEPWAQIARGNAADVDAAVAAAQQAFESGWGRSKPAYRAALLRALADQLEQVAGELAQIETRDNGKLIAETGGQTRYLPSWYRYYAGLAENLEGRVIPIDKPDLTVYTRPDPLGVIAAITPWNSPLMLATWKLAPALAAGNTVVLKPSEFTSASSIELARIFDEVGFPPGVFNVVTGFGGEVGAPLVAHPKVAKVAFTGGEAGGRGVYKAAAERLIPATLELGGKSPNIVFADADLDQAVKGVIAGIFAATGQTCLAGSRVLVEDGIHEAFVERLVAFAGRARLGDPADAGTQVGPVTTRPQYEKILSYIDVAKAEGARCVLGGGPAPHPAGGKGLFVQPTIFADVHNDMRIAREEVFGPVMAVLRFKDQADAIRIANDSAFGLAAGVWTQSLRRALEMSDALAAGTVWVNTYRAVSYLAPFGGYKASGIGRENGAEALAAYTQTKTVWLSTAAEQPDPFVMR
jgi:aldehyde dehydrogenase (NAD+)